MSFRETKHLFSSSAGQGRAVLLALDDFFPLLAIKHQLKKKKKVAWLLSAHSTVLVEGQASFIKASASLTFSTLGIESSCLCGRRAGKIHSSVINPIITTRGGSSLIYSHLRILVQTHIQENIALSTYKRGLGTGDFSK